MTAPRSLILNSPYECPALHWRDDRGSLKLAHGRRPAGYEIFDTRNNTRRTQALELVNAVRERVDAWRAAGYPGTTSVTLSLLEHWHDRGARDYPFYFCQIEAIETLIWWVEASAQYKQGVFVPGDGGAWKRLCNKMATGSGKTIVMAMVVAWQVLNALTYPKRNRDFSRAILVMAPGLTVKERLQVLRPGNVANVYDEFSICPSDALRQRLNQAQLRVENWHSLMPLKDTARSVVKKGAESDAAFVRRVLGDLSAARDIVVLNDEAHHAYRIPADVKISKRQAEEQGIDVDEATRWIEGLDRIHKVVRIQHCFDLSATPFAPTGKTNTEQGLFDWIISDFGLNDAIESGLVKTPRVVVRDGVIPDARTLRPKLYHLYREAEIRDDLNRKGAQAHEPLPILLQQAYTLLGADWRQAREDWLAAGHTSPPVMLTVCNRTETAARIEHYFNIGDAHWPELKDPPRTLRVDSRVLQKAEVGEKATLSTLEKDKFDAIIGSLCSSENRIKKFKACRKKADKIRCLIEFTDATAEDKAAAVQVPGSGALDFLFTHAPLAAEQREYFRSAEDYEARLAAIVAAAGLPADREAELLTQKKEELLRTIVDSVGKRGKAGQALQNVISVAMLSEGWDAKNVTHIMGLRAFTSQLLCEQVIGRGLRRVGYDTECAIGPDGVERELFKPEYVNVFGVPLSIFQDAGEGGETPPPPKPSTQIESLPERNALEICWPNVLRMDLMVKPTLLVDWDAVPALRLDTASTPLRAEIAPALGGATAWEQIVDIDLEKLPDEFRRQRLIFKAARKLVEGMRGRFRGTPEYLALQVIRLTERFLESGKVEVPGLFEQQPLRKRILVSLNMDRVVQHLDRHLTEQNQERIEPVFDEDFPLGSTRHMRTWYTTKRCQPAQKSQISHVVVDSAWEAHAANILESSDAVVAYAKNDHLGFQVHYLWGGSKRRYVPDFLIRLSNGKTLVLEIKGQDSDQNRAKRAAMETWTTGINAKGGFGLWCSDVALDMSQIETMIQAHCN